MPELGGQVAVDEVPTTVKATPAEELLMPTSGGSSTACVAWCDDGQRHDL